MQISTSDKISKFQNKWVALSKDRKNVLATATDIASLDKKVKKDKLKDVIYHYILPYHVSYSP